MVSERQTKILSVIVEDFINTAIPVSSGRVFDIEDWEISCPTIRNEMADLMKLGYLDQPHTSAGRVPTQKGYRFFVDSVLHSYQKMPRERNINLHDRLEDLNSFANDISAKVKSAVVFTSDKRKLTHVGLKRVFENPEFQTRKEVVALLEEIERLEDYNDNLFESFSEGVEIFIGSENPFFHGHDYGMISSIIDNNFISIIGPMRMDYEKGISIFNNLF